MDMTGSKGKFLVIDLGAMETCVLTPDENLYRDDLGGRGLAVRYLTRYADLSWDDPRMPILLFTGPMTGFGGVSASHVCVVTRSPYVSAAADACLPGAFGPQLKKAGYDGLIVRGRSDRPIGVEIDDDAVRFKGADHLLEVGVDDILEALRDKGSVMSTGPAAEAGVAFSSLAVDGFLGEARGGLGLSWAKKGLKYITVRGSRHLTPSDEGEFAEAAEQIGRLRAASPFLLGEHGLARYGSANLFDLVNDRRMLPTDGFTKTHFEHGGSVGACALERRIGLTDGGCPGCPLQCLKRGQDGSPAPDYSALAATTALWNNADLDGALEAFHAMRRAGLDPVSAAVTRCLVEDIEERPASMKERLEWIDLLARGDKRAALAGRGAAAFARHKGRPERALHVKGLEMPLFDPRGAYGLALSYMVSTGGPRHDRASALNHELLRKPVATDRFDLSGKARAIKLGEDRVAVADSLGICRHLLVACGLTDIAGAASAVIGTEVTSSQLARAGERAVYQERILEAGWGTSDEDERLPALFFESAGSKGPGFDVPALSRDAMDEARRRYYRIRGLDRRGRPTKEKSKELGLSWSG